MGVTLTDRFTSRQNEIATLAKAIAHPARVAILQHLARVNSCICGDIVEELPLSQATVSQHLRELKAAGWIKGEIEGTSVCYCINEKTWQRFSGLLDTMYAQVEKTRSCC